MIHRERQTQTHTHTHTLYAERVNVDVTGALLYYDMMCVCVCMCVLYEERVNVDAKIRTHTHTHTLASRRPWVSSHMHRRLVKLLRDRCALEGQHAVRPLRRWPGLSGGGGGIDIRRMGRE